MELAVDEATGEVVQRMEQDEFGRVLLDTNPGLHPFGFAGGLYDPETHLIRFGARDYDPQIGRWTARDPVREAGGVNAYLYALSAPVDGVDCGGFKDCRAKRIAAGAACLTMSVNCAKAAVQKDPFSIASCLSSSVACGAAVGMDLACEVEEEDDKPPNDNGDDKPPNDKGPDKCSP